MKIFAVYTNVTLTQKPDWLDDFRSRYDEPYPYHVTLKMPCDIKEAQVSEIKNLLSKLFSKPGNSIELTFNSLRIDDETSDDVCIMIDAEKNDKIIQLQKDVLRTLSKYNQYHKEKYQEYEKDFKPHITIARNLDEHSYAMASTELKQDFRCKGIITEVVLGIVDNLNATEANNPKNQTIYSI